MSLLYLDCQYGISGDMTLSALVDLGADLMYITDHLKRLPIDPFSLQVKRVNKRGISSKELDLQFVDGEHVSAASVNSASANGPLHSHDHEGHYHGEHHVHDHEGHFHGEHLSHDHHGHSHNEHHAHDHNEYHHHPHRKASSILEMIETSELPARVKERSILVFQEIAEAEGKIHGIDPKEVHFHEVGAMDSIIDIIGVCLALENLEVNKIIASPVPTGYGKIKIAHGIYPIPAPATAELLKGIPLEDFPVRGELTTPTGAGFLKALVKEYGYLPPLPIERIGYGAGKKDFDHPNVLRAILFKEEKKTQRENVTILECQVDDMTGETLGYIMEKVLSEGALDIYYTSVSMKKSRPGTLITVLTKPEDSARMEELLLRETSSFGVRKSQWTRRILSRRNEQVETPFGKVFVKIGYEEDQIYKISPEYEDVRKAARQYNVPLAEVYSAVQGEARKLVGL